MTVTVALCKCLLSLENNNEVVMLMFYLVFHNHNIKHSLSYVPQLPLSFPVSQETCSVVTIACAQVH